MARPWKPGEGHDQATKDKIRAEQLSNRLEKFINGEIELTPAQVNAAKILIDKGKPNLQAIEQRQSDPFEGMNEQELMEALRALISSNPEVARHLNIGLRPVESSAERGQDATNAAQHGDSSPLAA